MNDKTDPSGDSGAGSPQGYELSPMQQGMFFHSLDEHVPGVDIEQVTCRMREELDERSFLLAWQRVVERYPILRSQFQLGSHGQPVQQVCNDVRIPVGRQDWSALPAAETEARWIELKRTGREQGFDLAVAPLLRLDVVKRAAKDYSVLWTFHHILLDGRSFPVVLGEVYSLYDAFRQNTNLDLPRPRPFVEYIEWLRTVDFGRSEDFWRTQLSGFRAPTPLTISRTIPLPMTGQDAAGEREIRLTAEETTALRSLAGQHDVTLNTLLQGAWSILLHRYSREEDIVFGATRACRHWAADGADRMVGLFINTLPLRVKLTPETPVLELLKQVRLQQRRVRDHEHTPLVKVQGWSELPRGMSLFDSILVFDHLSLDEMLQATGVSHSTRQFQYRGQTNFPVTLIGYGGRELLLRLEYDRRKFEDPDIERMLGHLRNLLRGMVDAPEAKVSELQLLAAMERQEVLHQWNRGENYPPGKCIHQLFEMQAARTPDAVAVVYEDQQLTYRELNSRSNKLAARLQELGVHRDVLVGLCVERSIEMVVGILGILKAGGAYVPLDPAYPKERLGFMIEDANMPIVVMDRALSNELPSLETARRLYLDEFDAAPAENPSASATPESAAYVIYTSGSTGKPKGVVVTHHNVVRLFEATDGWFHFDEHDVWTLFHSYAFDFSVWELWGALVRGGRLVVVPYWVSRSPDAFLDLLGKERVTVLNQTPSAFRQLIAAEAERTDRPGLSLRYVIFGGEALELQSLKPWYDRHGDEHPLLVNMYGITETTVHVTYRPILLKDLEMGAGSVIGVPIPDLRVYVLDSKRQPVPIGVPGELYVGGAGVSRGYLNRDELTEERFIVDPFTSQGSGRLYKTGDLARRLSNGDLEYLGRIDLQVKIRGFRIELGEIEAVLNQHPAVRESVVIARQDTPGDKRLVAYIVVDSDEEQVVGMLRKILHEKLPEYMVPAAFVIMTNLPINENGKVDRRLLPVPDVTRAEPDRPHVAPRTPQEELLAGIWADVLKIKRVGVEDNFFELGGDSILSIQVISRCRQAGLKLSPRDLFRHPTVGSLAMFLLETPAEPRRVQVVEPMAGPVALTPIQHWFFDQNFAEPRHWNQAFMFEVAAGVDVDRLESALNVVVEHHDAFRLSFSCEGGKWLQTAVDRPGRVRMVRVDVSDAESDFAKVLDSRIEELQAGLSLSKPPLLNAVHFHRGDSRHGRLLLIVHHLVVDGVSWRILMEDLESACRDLENGIRPVLPTKTSSYQQWSRRLAGYGSSEAARSSIDAWLECVEAGGSALPGVVRNSGNNSEAGARTVTMKLGGPETRALLQDVPSAYLTQINDILITALARVMTRWKEANEIQIDMEGHGREDIFEGMDLSRTVGWFTTLFPVRIQCDRTADLPQTIKSVKEQLRRVPDRGLSFGILRYLAEPDEKITRLRRQASSEVLFNYLGQFDQVVADSRMFKFAPEPVECWHSPRGQRTHAIEVLCLILNGELEIRWIHGQDLHNRETIQSLAAGFVQELQGIIRHCVEPNAGGRTPSDFPLARVSQKELDAIVTHYPDSEDLYPLSSMQSLFHSMQAADGELGFEQWRFSLQGNLDPAILRRAWEQVLSRHPILRSAFVSDGLVEPHQVVLGKVRPKWTEHDWRDIPGPERDDRIQAFCDADRREGFDVEAAPLIRLALFRVSEHEWELIWSTHHLLIDGWSWPVVFKDLSAFYLCGSKGSPVQLPTACVYRDYIGWMRRQNRATQSETFWRDELGGFTRPTPLDLPGPESSAAPSFGVTELRGALSEKATEELHRFARTNQLTLSTVVQGAWAMLLSHYSGLEEVVFGAAFSGRPPEVPGIAEMVGPCVNNVPVRALVRRDEELAKWLSGLQRRHFEMDHHQYASLRQIQGWSQVPWRFRLFDSLLVFQNYTTGESTERLGEGVSIRLVTSPEATNYPLTLSVTPGNELVLKALFRSSRYRVSVVDDLLRNFEGLLESIPGRASERLEHIMHLLPKDAKGLANGVAERSKMVDVERLPSSPPLNEMEQRIAKIWQDLFQLEQVGMDVNFFDLGGHSLLLMRAHERLRESVDAEIPVVALLKYPTIRLLARQLSMKEEGKAASHFTDRARKQREASLRHKVVRGRDR